MLTHTEKIAAALGLGLGLLLVVGFLFDQFVLMVTWWPLVGSEWRYERRKAAEGPEIIELPRIGRSIGADENGPWYQDSPDSERVYYTPEPDWENEPSSDADADEMIATWRGDDLIRDTLDPRFDPSAFRGYDPQGFRDEEHEQLATVHPIYLDLSEDPDLIVWDAKQQASRCWEIVHIEFPRLRAELASMWEAAA